MSTAARLHGKRWYIYAAAIVLSGGLLFVRSAPAHVSAQGTNSIYVTPATGNYSTGGKVTVSVRFNAGEPVNAVQADMSYSSNLEFVSFDDDDSALSINASSTGGSGSVSIARGNTTPVSGDKLLSKVTFKVVSAGTGTIQMKDSSTALTSANNTNIITTRKGSSFALNGATQPSTPPSSPNPSSPAPKVTPPGSPTDSKVTISSPSGDGKTGVPDNSKIELEAPAVIETNPEAGREVVKVEYLIDGTVVSVSTTAPYRHSIDTKQMRNGTYDLLVKTYYKDGHIDESKASLEVKNPFGLAQAWLQVKHYAWVGGILLLLVVAYLVFRFIKKPKWTPSGPGKDTTFGPSSGIGTPVVGGGSGPTFGSSMDEPAAGSGPVATAGDDDDTSVPSLKPAQTPAVSSEPAANDPAPLSVSPAPAASAPEEAGPALASPAAAPAAPATPAVPATPTTPPAPPVSPAPVATPPAAAPAQPSQDEQPPAAPK